MINNNVFAVIVTYNGDANLLNNIKSLEKQTQEIVVVDNNSQTDMNEVITYCKNNNIQIVFNDKNYGIATALNIGAKIGREKNYKYLLTMDQDSILDENAVDEMIKVIEKDDSIWSVGTNYLNLSCEEDFIPKDVLITSGNLTYMNIFDKVGGFNDILFIDCVDFDFSLSIRKMGGQIGIATNAKMTHKIGEKTEGSFLFFKIKLSQHSAFRYYYMYRNHYYIIKKYKKDFAKFCFKKSIFQFILTLLILFLHQDKKNKIKALRKGKQDSKQLIKELT